MLSKVLIPQVIIPIGAIVVLVILYKAAPALAVAFAFIIGMAAGGVKT
jgi:hypothetical protein